MVDLRMIVTKTRLQVNGLVKYNCSTEGNLSRRFNEKKFLVLVSLNGDWHLEWNYVFSEITKFNFVKTIMFWAKTMSAKEGKYKTEFHGLTLLDSRSCNLTAVSFSSRSADISSYKLTKYNLRHLSFYTFTSRVVIYRGIEIEFLGKMGWIEN